MDIILRISHFLLFLMHVNTVNGEMEQLNYDKDKLTTGAEK